MSANIRSLRVVQPNKADDYLTGRDLYASITKAGFLVVRSGEGLAMGAYPPGQWTSIHAALSRKDQAG